jgi:hypothetical protein
VAGWAGSVRAKTVPGRIGALATVDPLSCQKGLPSFGRNAAAPIDSTCCSARGAAMAEIVKLTKFRRSPSKPVKGKPKPQKLEKRQKGHKWRSFRTEPLSMPPRDGVDELAGNRATDAARRHCQLNGVEVSFPAPLG